MRRTRRSPTAQFQLAVEGPGRRSDQLDVPSKEKGPEDARHERPQVAQLGRGPHHLRQAADGGTSTISRAQAVEAMISAPATSELP